MPRRPLTEAQAAQIVALLQENFSQRYVARRLNVSQSVVSRAWSRFLETRSFDRRSGQGRRRVTSRRTDRQIVRSVLNDPVIIANQVVNEIVVHQQGNRISDQTIRRRLHEVGLRSRNRVRVPALTLNHRRARLEYAQTHVQWTAQQWRNVLFTDESRFVLHGNDRRIRIWRRRGERYEPRHMARIRAFGGGSIMVWAGISVSHRTELVIIPPPGLNSARYVDEILRPHVLPLRNDIGENFIFMQDNARPHTARYTTDFLRRNNIVVLNHPPLSPDLNPIEQIWDLLDRRLRNFPNQPQNLRELGDTLQRIWREIPQDLIRRFFNMQLRCQEVIRRRGGNTQF